MSHISNPTHAHPVRRPSALAALIALGLAVQPMGLAPSTPDVHLTTAGERTLPAPPTVARRHSTGSTGPNSTVSRVSKVSPRPPEDAPVVIAVPSEIPTTDVTSTTTPTAAPIPDPFASITSPDVGDHCAQGLGADDLTDFFSEPIGPLQGADYQRALRLDDDRVLWTFQDAFISGTLVHNVGVLQSGRCFTVLNDGARSWLFAETTVHKHQWYWILDGAQASDRSIHLFVAQMNERGSSYLGHTEPTRLRRVVLDAMTLEVVSVVDEPPTGTDLYGWAVTSDESYTYLYSHCYRQFGFEPPFGFDACSEDVKLARVPTGSFDGPREYWDGSGWTNDHAHAQPVVDESFVVSGNNPAQVRFDGDRFLLVEKREDWWGTTVEFGVADAPQGPFRHVISVEEPRKCELWKCNTYFAAWLPWTDPSGAHIWSISHNRWNGAETSSHLDVYRPTFQTVTL